MRADRRFFESCSQGRVGCFGDSLFKHQTALSGQCRVNAVVSGVADPAMLYSLVCCCRVDSVNIAPDARAGSSVMQPQEFVHEGVAVGAGVPEQSGGEVIHQVVEAGMGSVEDGLGKHACHAVRRKIAQIRGQGEHVRNRHVVHGEIGVVVPEMDTPGDTTPACQITTKRNAGRVVGRSDRIGDAAVVAGQLDVYVVAGTQRPGRPLGIGISQCANQYVRVFFRDACGDRIDELQQRAGAGFFASVDRFATIAGTFVSPVILADGDTLLVRMRGKFVQDRPCYDLENVWIGEAELGVILFCNSDAVAEAKIFWKRFRILAPRHLAVKTVAGQSDRSIATKAGLRRHRVTTQTGSKSRILRVNLIRRVPIRKTWSVTSVGIGKRFAGWQFGRVGVVDGEETNPQEILEESIDAVQSATRTAANDCELTLAYDNPVLFCGQVVCHDARKVSSERCAVANVNLLRERSGGYRDDRQRDTSHHCETSLEFEGSVAGVRQRVRRNNNFTGLECCDGLAGGSACEECVAEKSARREAN